MGKFEPFLRWAGGKTWLVPFVSDLINKIEYRNYIEPFLGGGAVFFSINPPKRVYLSDINKELIETYIAVRDDPETVIKKYRTIPNTEDSYYAMRNKKPRKLANKAARFIYLNQTSYNGLYRVNLEGKYNVPYGFRDFWTPDIDQIRSASKKLKKTTIRCEDFSARKYRIGEGDLVFLDPPYTVSHNQNGFIKYNQKLFSIEDQYRLSKYIDYIKTRGAYYILTNAAHNDIVKIFDKGDSIIALDRNSLIGGKNAIRDKTTEYVFTNIP